MLGNITDSVNASIFMGWINGVTGESLLTLTYNLDQTINYRPRRLALPYMSTDYLIAYEPVADGISLGFAGIFFMKVSFVNQQVTWLCVLSPANDYIYLDIFIRTDDYLFMLLQQPLTSSLPQSIVFVRYDATPHGSVSASYFTRILVFQTSFTFYTRGYHDNSFNYMIISFGVI